MGVKISVFLFYVELREVYSSVAVDRSVYLRITLEPMVTHAQQ